MSEIESSVSPNNVHIEDSYRVNKGKYSATVPLER